MNLLEIWRGTPKELDAISKAQNLLESKRKVPERTRKEILDAGHSAQRRILLKRIGVGGGIVVSGGLGYVISRILETSDVASITANKEAAYRSYIESFATLAQGDEEAEKILSFFIERRKRGKLVGNNILADEPGVSGQNFYTVMVDPVKDHEVSRNMRGASEFKQNLNPPSLLLRTSPMTSIWRGALIGHEALHVYQWLNGIEQQRGDGFFRGEQEAYDLEFRLLDRATGGRFKQILRQQAPSVAQNSYRGKLSSDDERAFQALFPSVQNEDEIALRIPAYIVALNFTVAEMRSANPTDEKIKYLRQVFGGSIPLLR